MRHRGLLFGALALIAIGAVGLSVLPLLTGGVGGSLGSFSSNGQRIFYTGANEAGSIPRTVVGGGVGYGMMGYGMMGDVGCVTCHGTDGRGGTISMMMWVIEVPDIRYTTLSAPRSEEGTTVPGWSESDIERAIRDGVEPNGERLKAPMPRWRMSDADVADVIAYLKELSKQ